MNQHDPDRQLAVLFHDSTSDLAPDVADLVAGGIARGRAQRRRRRVGTTLAAAAVIGVIGVAASVAPGLGGDSSPTGVQVATEGPSQGAAKSPTPEPTAAAPDAALAVRANQIPGEIGAMLPAGQAGPPLTMDPYPLVNEADTRTVHFRWNGALTTFSIEPAATLGSCQEIAGDAGVCRHQGGVDVLTWGPSTGDGVTAQAVMVWQHGYAVSVLSYNAPHGKEVAPIFDAPPISIEQLTDIASSEVWFSAS